MGLLKVGPKVKLKLQFVFGTTILTLSSLFFSASLAFAQSGGQTTTSSFGDLIKNGIVHCGNKDAEDGKRPDDTCTVEDMFIIIARVTNFLIGFSGVFVVYKFVNGAFGLVTANGDEHKITGAKEGMMNAFWGLLLILVAYVLVSAVLYSILQLNYNKKDLLENPTQYINNPEKVPKK